MVPTKDGCSKVTRACVGNLDEGPELSGNTYQAELWERPSTYTFSREISEPLSWVSTIETLWETRAGKDL